ncbi:Hypothetical predicted protein [Podarcis lilfordi]|uniref:Uncharacterized protein n=1 Tax=Podarcis lilfordi TaxID=74358 RepID=A0AA35K235_9SAUR|nr:Hypothetical predicted protein [Podarcis lilfordi]
MAANKMQGALVFYNKGERRGGVAGLRDNLGHAPPVGSSLPFRCVTGAAGRKDSRCSSSLLLYDTRSPHRHRAAEEENARARARASGVAGKRRCEPAQASPPPHPSPEPDRIFRASGGAAASLDCSSLFLPPRSSCFTRRRRESDRAEKINLNSIPAITNCFLSCGIILVCILYGWSLHTKVSLLCCPLEGLDLGLSKS